MSKPLIKPPVGWPGPAVASGVLEAAKTIFWAFAGIRRRQHGESDSVRLSPLQIVVAGILGGAVFVLGLAVLVHFIVSSHAAAT